MTKAQGRGRDVPDDRWQFLARVAELYYLEQRTQSDIGQHLGISRIAVSRMLAEAATHGVVEFHINNAPPRRVDLEQALSEAFPGVSFSVAPSQGEVVARVGRLAAAVCESVLSPGMTVGISYGRAVFETIKAIGTQQLTGVSVVQMAGVEGARNPEINGWELVKLCADRLGAHYQYLPTPLFSSTPQSHELLLEDPRLSEVLARARRADFAIVGIGSMDPQQSSLVRAGHLTAQELRKAAEAGSVGYICGQHYDANGRPIDRINRLTFSIELDDLKNIGKVLGVAYGIHKAQALLGALRGGFLSQVATDDAAAQAMVASLTGE